MGVQDLQAYLEGGTVQGSCSNVDLVRIAKTMSARFVKQAQKKGANHQPNQFSLVVDGECCLDRLYGGYFSDWACGGQWNRMVMFLSQFVNSLKKANIDLVVFFNGCIESQRMKEWVQNQQQTRVKVNQVLRHITTKGTPPPKVWWTPPVCLRTAVRMVLRHLEVTVMCTMDDHHQEVIAYCRENALHGLLADDAEYAAFDPPRYFSARQLKLTYKGSLETKEYNLSELNKEMGLSTEKLCILVALLGNYILTENDLVDIYKKQGINQPVGKIPAEVLVEKMAALVKSLPAGEKLADTCAAILGSDKDPRLAKLKQSIQYYLDGTKDGFLDYRAANTGKKHRGNKNKQDHSAADKQNAATAAAAASTTTATTDTIQEPDLDTTRLASETAESEMTSLQQYKEATAAMPQAKPEIIIDDTGKEAPEPEVAAATTGSEPEPPLVNGSGSPVQNGGTPNQLAIDSSSSNSSSPGATSPARGESAGEKNSKKGGKKDKDGGGKGGGKGGQPIQLPPVASEVMRTVSERHNKGLMSPFMYQILAQGEIKLPVIMEDEQHKEIPSIHLFYKPIRQMVYAILFNMHHHTFMANKNKEKTGQEGKLPDIRIKEWVCTKNNPYNKPEIVKAESLGWGVPTVQRLWFGTTMDDMRRRRRAYLTCMRSDTPLIVNYDYVPQHILIMATVLRYMMSFPEKKVLRRSELDAFIVTTLAPELMNAEYNQELQLPVVSSRGVQLATMFMQGVETALLVNDACGAPIPWLMCCPWLFFDGKLFHHHLARASQAKNLSELCEHRLRVIMKVERVRQAILEGLNVQFARPPLPLVIQNSRASPLYSTPGAPPGAHAHMVAAGMIQSQRNANQAPPNSHLSSALASHAHASMLSARGGIGGALSRRAAGIPSNSGGRLEIAGVVVGSWGPNYGLSTLGVNRSMMLQPQVTSVNAVSNYTGVSFRGGRPSFNTNRGGGVNKGGKGRGGFKAQQTNKKRSTSVGSSQKKENKKTGKGRGMTVVLPDTGETVLATEMVDDVSDKKILMNRTNNANNTEMVNGKTGGGGGGGDDLIGQFEDACTIENGAMNGEGDAKINSILATATEGN